MSLLELTALTLSPIHVGDGSTMTPEAFKLEGENLLRFDPAAVVTAMDERTRRRFLQAVDRNELHEAQRIIQSAAGPSQVRERIAISRQSMQETRQAVDNPERSGRIHPFVRTGGRPCLPGSAIKGAIRTALLSHRAQADLPHHRQWLEAQHIERGNSGRQSDVLQQRILGETDSDPLRFLRVSDCELPADSTRIEQVFNRRRDGRVNAMQMHFECLGPGTRLTLRLDLRDGDARKAGAIDPSKAPHTAVTEAELRDALSAFYRERWNAEIGRFFAGDPWLTGLPPMGADGFPLLLRVGRFSHFESASVEGLRKGWQPMPKPGRSVSEGSTRAVVDRDGAYLPFGWLLLAPKGRESLFEGLRPAARQPSRVGGRPAQPAPGAARVSQPPTLAGRRGSVDGEAVEVLRDDGDDLQVRFLESGDIESIARHEFEED